MLIFGNMYRKCVGYTLVNNIYFCLYYILAQCYFKFKGDILNTEIKICILKTSL